MKAAKADAVTSFAANADAITAAGIRDSQLPLPLAIRGRVIVA